MTALRSFILPPYSQLIRTIFWTCWFITTFLIAYAFVAEFLGFRLFPLIGGPKPYMFADIQAIWAITTYSASGLLVSTIAARLSSHVSLWWGLTVYSAWLIYTGIARL